MSDYYILSVKWTRSEGHLVWWRPDNSGYTENLDLAGIYTEEQVNARRSYYDRDHTRAVPVEKARELAMTVVVSDYDAWKKFDIRDPEDSEGQKARKRVDDLQEFAWHNESTCQCDICKKIEKQKQDAIEGR